MDYNLVKTFKHGEKHITGWNRYCKNLHGDARKKFLIWHSHGRIRVGETFEAMKTSRSTFKKALKFCRKNELRLKKEILLAKFKTKKSKFFWKEVSEN